MPASRCTICALNWPQNEDFEECPECGEPTSKFNNVDAMPDDEARSLKNHADFERFYAEYDATAGPLESRGTKVEEAGSADLAQ